VSKPATKDKPLLFVSKMPLFGFIRFQTEKLGYKNILCNWFGLLHCSKIMSFFLVFESERQKFDTSFFSPKNAWFFEARKLDTIQAEYQFNRGEGHTPRLACID